VPIKPNDPFEDYIRRKRRQDDIGRINKNIQDGIRKTQQDAIDRANARGRHWLGHPFSTKGVPDAGPALLFGCLGVLALIAFGVWSLVG
jgi:hypothetical protein